MLNRDNIFFARVYLESTSPLAIASGYEYWNEDQPVLLDSNGLPYIPGTAIAGFLRSAFKQYVDNDQQLVDELFGFQQGGLGAPSKLHISSGHLCWRKDYCIEGLIDSSYLDKEPILKDRNWKIKRDRVRINAAGVVDASGKYDTSAVAKGMRFVFDIKLSTENHPQADWEKIKDLISSPTFRLGGSTTNGFGRFKVRKIVERLFMHDSVDDLKAYCGFTGSFNEALPNANVLVGFENKSHLKRYQLELVPRDFFIFQESNRAIEDEADMLAKKEETLVWGNSDEPKMSEGLYLIPASSLKGALSHRSLFHYNRLKGVFADTSASDENHEGKRHGGLNRLFGHAKNSRQEIEGSKGLLIFNDVYLKEKVQKLERISHVSIDPLTQGARPSALFSEEPLNKNYKIDFDIYLEQPESLEPDALKSFELALQDLCNGRLPLGGGVNRGHGLFTGTMKEF
jgi:CRISPR/Cas system CSM-associated protein Csm3 (group 7 of RAMP superfamily)